MRDLQGLAQLLPPHGTLITPQAPHPGGPWGYGPGWAWYRYLGEDKADPRSLAESLEALDAFLRALPSYLGHMPGSLVLGGFSQGGTMSLAYALTHTHTLAGVVVLSGFLMNQEILGRGAGALGSTPLFWAHGTQDPAVPHELARGGRREIREAGGRMETRDYPMGHWVSREEISDLKTWLEGTIPDWRG